jgi:F0F1-type ATP synthase assembly protein I
MRADDLPDTGVMGEREANVWRMVGNYLGLAFMLPLAVAIGYVIGYLLDRWLGTHFFYIVFLLLGIAAGFIELIRQLQKDTRAK